MPRNGAGSYTLVSGNPVVTNTTISSTWANNTLSDIATALTQSIAKDGQTVPTANLPMGGFKLTNLASGTAATDSANLGQTQSDATKYLASVAGTDTITGSLNPAITAYAAGQTFRFVAAASNTGAVTININSLGAKAITKEGTTALAAGDILINALYEIVYDGTQFQLVNSSIDWNGGTVSGATTFSADVTMSGATMKWVKGADVASATALPLITDGNYFDVTGTTTITSFNSVGVGTWVALQFDGALTLTHNATDLILPGAANITTAAGDEAIFIEYASGDYRCISYTKASGLPIAGGVTQMTTNSSTAVTEKDFTGIPSTAKIIVIASAGSSLSGTSSFLVQIGNTTFTTSSYVSTSNQYNAASTTSGVSSTAGFVINSGSATNVFSGAMTLIHITGNVWVSYHNGKLSTTNVCSGGGDISLGAVLDRVRITTVNGTDTFDAGSFNVIYY
ncbi:MAG: hypothetical protein WC733_03835 [Methylophilus sp.]|jgi:hypothetical protein